ncbi:ComF family protein [Candidatus Saccharibacteria bacterium]|nr:ComF family protein [Candidatus Saccharibacteria bacterium]
MPKNVKITTRISIIDLFAPHSCRGCGRLGSPLCNRCKKYILSTTHSICPYCHQPSTGLCTCHKITLPVYTIGERSGLLDLALHAYKYDSTRALAPVLAALLAARLPSNLPATTVIVPLPTATHHIRSRGFDHTRLLAKHLSRITGFPVAKLLLRSHNTVQVGTDKITRITQARSAYALNPHSTIGSSATYLLLDDIWTTGASMLAAADILKSAGAHNLILAPLAISIL